MKKVYLCSVLAYTHESTESWRTSIDRSIGLPVLRRAWEISDDTPSSTGFRWHRGWFYLPWSGAPSELLKRLESNLRSVFLHSDPLPDRVADWLFQEATGEALCSTR